MRRASLLAALLLAAAPAIAQKIYRCGPDASTYSQQPCADGKALDLSDPRSAAQRREAQKAATQNAKLADAMEREREQAERRIKPATAGSLSAEPEPPAQVAKAPKAAASKPTIYREPVKPKTSPQ
ncbi:hypothetical protein [Rivibacter subsaxonicus]|uniref:DUF4124 domain-containing protein n=1 Tax=Rivibacter subsaxonicus TaxID=457575 RepID=A0A4Q7VGD6_9BURK|nr:hypothetical protein [Rivibacter subsaxonicus]RZT95057.1 hypothetical protein EV670_2805 [Rivibacter subsaxonicus]